MIEHLSSLVGGILGPTDTQAAKSFPELEDILSSALQKGEFGATLPEERFYSMLGLLASRSAGSRNTSDADLINSKSSEDAVLEFSKLYLRAANNLQLLNQIEDIEYRLNKDLASWVPDLEARLLPKPLEYDYIVDGNNFPDCDSFGAHPCFSFDPSGRILQVEGAHLDTIAAVSEPFNSIKPSHNWLSVLSLLNSVVIPAKYPISIDEIFIRTLLTIPPYINIKNPAHLIPELEFSDWIVRNLASISSAKSEEYHDVLGISDLLKKTKEALASLWELNPTTSAFPSPDRVNEALKVLEDTQEGDLERDTIFRNAENFEAKLDMRLHSRKMFVTASGCLGLGMQSVQVGDGVYFLKGTKMPFVLRENSDKTYQVLGHSFVYGLLEDRIERDVVAFEGLSLV